MLVCAVIAASATMLAGGEPYAVLFFVACLSLYVYTLHPSIAGERFVTESARDRWEANAAVVRAYTTRASASRKQVATVI